ncbi:LOW QUALITY PROTEIN: telomerase-binding protein EST1A-like [Uloborus diversus]|uniref:LOW QUALITY PROTEIN: telomerase-binding protein EST1A-like n=1 Tax=Uloborus diversus TaxID=327109 RepID=UPI002409F236|nr:LOW QUALITY PROTEIN: telomerase-binding protein EST1A-like [Uloborus diversus]
MKQSKKEHRKPEQQIYRPGMGLHNRNIRTDEFKDSKAAPDLPRTSSHCDGSDSATVNRSNHEDSHSKKAHANTKNTKNRRPDIQVYTPKPKIVAQSSDKKQDSQKPPSDQYPKAESEDISNLPSKKLSPSFPKKSVFEHDDRKSPTQKSVSKSSVTKVISANSSEKKSWASMVEESDLLNSRSTSDDRMCNGHLDDGEIQTSVAKDGKCQERKSSKSIKDDSNKSRHRVRRNSLKSENPHVPIEELDKSDVNIAKINKQSFNSSQQKHKNSEEKERRHRKVGTFLRARNSEDNKQNYESNQSKNAMLDKTKIEKKRREKTEITIPPRFQKLKSSSVENQQNSLQDKYNLNHGGGLLKLPTEYESPEVVSETLSSVICPPKAHREPPMFIHKQLFDPNNPSKPEIVNIPAHIPPSHVSYTSSKYYTPEPVKSSYISSPMPSAGYIPPPQPPAMSSSYRFVQQDIPLVSSPDSFHPLRDGIAPPVPSVPDARLNAVFTRPSQMFSEMSLVGPEAAKKRLKPIVEKNLNDIVMLERELSSLLKKGIGSSSLNNLRQCRWKLQLRYENIILADPKYCAEKNPEQSLWKTAFHQIIENLRKKLEEDPKDEEARENLMNLILEGTVFYENLLEKQQETYGFNLTRLLEMEHINTACIPEQIRIVLISTQKLLIYLGDLSRYKEQASQTANFGKARSWYLKAQVIAPKNGRPYNQLAILALNARRKLDAVYFYVRSLAASNPFLSAKESLLSLFEEAKRKYEVYEKKRNQAKSDEVEALDAAEDERHEVWIKPDGSSSCRPAEMDKNLDASDFKNLSDVELNKRFVTSFLHVHGKLFTKIGMESFLETLNHMLKEFYFLLQRTPLPITSSRLLQLLAINIFSVTNSSLKENGRELGGSSLLQEQALYTSMIMMSLVMERCKLLHIAHKASPEFTSQVVSDDLAQLLPSVKIWTDWMSCQKSLWPPPPPYVLEKLNVRFNKNVWVSFADLLTALHEIDVSSPVIINERKEDSEPVILEEDCAFAGFVPLMGAIHDPAYSIVPFDKDKAKHCLRISRIQFFGDYLCGITPPYMQFDVERKKFVSLVNHICLEERLERTVLYSSTDETYRDDDLDDNLVGETSHGSVESNELQILWSRKEALSKQKKQQEKYRAQVQAVLQKHQNQRPIVLKIKPRYLIPDTNCFVDHLKLFRNILASSEFHLIIPLVVINELDGLARGTRVNEHTSPEHASRVTVLSRDAIHFLEQQFALRHPHLRAITSKGSIMDTISFRSEEMGKNKGTNDDLILTCCLYYCKDRAKDYMPKSRDEPMTLFREVVLLTDDRNLRVKALAHHVPVRDLLSFLQWVNS